MDAAGVRTRNDILFVGDVGEEGLGDLRGVRHLFSKGRYRDKIAAFITVDSPQMVPTSERRRYREGRELTQRSPFEVPVRPTAKCLGAGTCETVIG